MTRERLVVVIDLKKDLIAACIERTEVMFFMRVVGVAEIVLHRYGLDNPFDSFLAEGSDAGCNDCEAAKQMLAKLVVERTNLFGFGGHDGISFYWDYVLRVGLPHAEDMRRTAELMAMVELGLVTARAMFT